MTTSQASRVYGIPYNSLLMYVRGKYGKSLKLDKLKETTPAAKDNLNTIGNSRSTPKEKMTIVDPSKQVKSKHGSGSSSSSKSSNGTPKTPNLMENFENNPFMAAMTGMTGLAPLTGNAGTTADSSRVKEVMQQMQTRQAILDHSERLKEIEKHMGSEQAKLLMPFFTGSAPSLPPASSSPCLEKSEDMIKESPDNDQENVSENVSEKERQVQDILLEAARKSKQAEQVVEEDDNKNNVSTASEVIKPLDTNPSTQPSAAPPGEISAS